MFLIILGISCNVLRIFRACYLAFWSISFTVQNQLFFVCHQLIHRSFVGTDGRAGACWRAGARALLLLALGRTSSPSLGAFEWSRLPPATDLWWPRLCRGRSSPLQCDDGDPAAPAQRVGADRDSGGRSLSALYHIETAAGGRHGQEQMDQQNLGGCWH